MSAETGASSSEVFPCSKNNQDLSLVGGSATAREELYRRSIEDPARFWSSLSREQFFWKTGWPCDANVCSYNFDRQKGPVFVKWFEGGLTNVCYNALDRHAKKDKDRICFYWEGNDPNRQQTITYGEMLEWVIRTANVLRFQYGIGKGDVVAMYLPMIPFTVVCMMACARIGAASLVVFAGFSPEALATRLEDGKPKLLITADASFRGTKPVLLKSIVDAALAKVGQDQVTSSTGVSGVRGSLPCLVYPNEGRKHCEMMAGRDAWYDDAEAKLSHAQRQDCPIEWVEAEHILFILYTSGSTGRPKAVVHTTGGYMVYSATTFRYVFDYHPEDIYFCTGDVGWITGHSYGVYGPMLNGATSVLFEGIFNYPTLSRWWELVEKYRVTLFYTAPTALRMLRKYGEAPLRSCDRSSLRVLGSVGEPMNTETWHWYYEVVGNRLVDIVDTYWQTETGGHMLTGLPGCNAMKPGCTGLPFLGVKPVLLDHKTWKVLEGNASGLLAMAQPWPGICRTLLGEHEKYEQLYFSSNGFFLTGDGARRDEDGYYWITGRVDDVLNVSGHRLGTSEIEDAVTSHPSVVECAVVGVPHDIKGESVYVYFTPRPDVSTPMETLMEEIKKTVRQRIGPLAVPDVIHPAPGGLPKTRSGKLVRRMLRKIAMQKDDDLGDTSTLLDPSVVKSLIDSRKKWVEKNEEAKSKL